MALNAFNEFTDLDAVNGVFQQEPRVFAHDAAPITIGAINNSDPNHGLNMTSGGTDYAVDDVLTLSTGASASVAAAGTRKTEDSRFSLSERKNSR